MKKEIIELNEKEQEEIIKMKIRCKKCNDIIEGDKKGTPITCKCGAVSIDETEYIYVINGNYGDFEEIIEDKKEIKN